MGNWFLMIILEILLGLRHDYTNTGVIGGVADWTSVER